MKPTAPTPTPAPSKPATSAQAWTAYWPRQSATNGTYHYLSDALGSTTRLTDDNGATLVNYSYDPYGGTRADAQADNLFQYTGRENDQTGLYYYRARYYSPAYQRFISEDPIGLAGGINVYAYVGGNPVSFVDAEGNIFFPALIGAAIGFGFDLVTQLIENGGRLECIDGKQLLLSTAMGALGGGIGGAAAKGGLRQLGMKTKGKIGESLSYVENKLRGSSLQGTQQWLGKYRTYYDSVWKSPSGNTYYVESKFGMSPLSKGQKAAQAGLGDACHVERWGYDFLEELEDMLAELLGRLYQELSQEMIVAVNSKNDESK